ncbi:MAG TPA: hypothetical protein VD866_26490, partial [Urbifossiella sp.]|nr:hypothetical protein [Urbifossiella sp.]
MSLRRLILTLFAALLPAPAWGQPFGERQPQPEKRISREGSQVFRWLLDQAKLKPLTDSQQFSVVRSGDFSDTVVIVLGPWQRQFARPGNLPVAQWMTRAAEGGGAVLVAHDEFVSVSLGNGVAPVQFSGTRVVTKEPEFGGEWLVLNQNEMTQFAVPRPAPPDAGPEWDVLGGERPLRRVVNELPGTLANLKGGILTPLAGFPPNAQFQRTGVRLARNENVFIAGAALPHPTTLRPFRFLAVADQAVFRNGDMVARDENGPTDNMEFADRAVTFLTQENGVQQRTKCLLVVDGDVKSNYDELTQLLRPPLPPLPKIDWEKVQPKLVDLGNHLLDKVQENDIPNQMLVQKNPDAPGSWYRTLLGVLLTMAAIWAAWNLRRRLGGAREPTDLAGAPPGGRPPPPPDGAAGVFGRRGKELTTRDNLLEPARAACRDFFDTVGRPPDPGPRLPKVVISDVVKKPDTLRQALREIWAV